MRNGNMAAKTQDFDIPIIKGHIVRKKINRTKIVYVDINFPDATATLKMDAIVFQNYYCSSLSIAQQVDDDFVTVLENYQLMKDSHSEYESQLWHEISCQQFNKLYVPGGRTVRISMFQPDSIWQKFEIQHIRAVSKAFLEGKSDQRSLASVDSSSSSISIMDRIKSDWTILVQENHSQKDMIIQPEIKFTLSEYLNTIKKKEKKKEKNKGAAGGGAGSPVAALPNDDFGIAIPHFSSKDDAI